MFNNIFENLTIYEMWTKYCTAGQAHYMMGTQSYKHTLRTCNTFLLSHRNSGCTKEPQRYVTLTLSVLLSLVQENE
jgi:hypothetical protein